MSRINHKLKALLIYLGLLIAVTSGIFFISMNFGDQRVHIEKKHWNPAEAADQGLDPKLLKKAAEYIETRLPMARSMIIIKNGKTVHEKYYWKGGPQEKDYLHSLNGPILHALVGIAIEKHMLAGPAQPLADFFPDYFPQWQGRNSLPLTVADLLQVQVPLIWGAGPSEYWELFYAGDKIGASIQVLSTTDASMHPAANFAANFLLAEIIQAVSPMNLFEFADQHLFQPMGIATQAEIKNQGGLMNAFVGFKLRALDMAKFGYLIMNDGIWEDRQLLPRDWTRNITGELRIGPGKSVMGGWQFSLIDSTESFMARGEGGQYIVLSPELDMLIAVTSKSQFPLSENSGYDQLFQMIFESVIQKSIPEETAGLIVDNPDERPYYEPNFVYSTDVPDDIRQFFYDLAKDIATNDINRILYHYAKGYENDGANMGWLDKFFLKGDDYRSMYGYWKNMFAGGTGELEFVQIEKLRIDNNRAYLRGTLKYSYANMNTGSIGWFPLENLIKLRGRWQWLGSPEYGAILDRDEYFDAEISADLNEFIDDCGPAFTGTIEKNNTACFSGNFMHNGLQQQELSKLLKPLWDEDRKVEFHITKAEQTGEDGLVEGYIENSLIGTVSLPAGMKIVQENGRWKWSGNGVE
jgi:CubicO group peptidase (beta-lactamase class C family)